MDLDELREQVSEVVASYLDQLEDPGDVDSDDLADNIVRVFGKVVDG